MEERHLRNDSIYRWLAPEDPYGESSPAPVPARAPCSADPITAAGGWAQTAIIPSAMPSSCALSPEDSNDAFFAQIPETPSNTERSPYVSFDEEYTRDERLKHLGRTVAPKVSLSSLLASSNASVVSISDLTRYSLPTLLLGCPSPTSRTGTSKDPESVAFPPCPHPHPPG